MSEFTLDEARYRSQIAALTAEVLRLQAEVREARNEAAVVRRAYLHEKARADAAGAPEAKAYTGPAQVLATGKAIDPRCTCPNEGPCGWEQVCQFCKGYPDGGLE